MKRKNVVVLTIDALHFSRLGFAGHRPSPSPTLDALLAEGLTCTQAFTPGVATQFAMPAVHTSTLPLDHGGYEWGIRDREATMAEAFSAAGYRTGAIQCAGPVTRGNGYDRGFETFVTLTGPFPYSVAYFKVHWRYYASRYRDGSLSLDLCTEQFSQHYLAMLDTLRDLCRERDAEIVGGVPLTPVIHNWDHARVLDLIDLEEGWFRRDPRAYVHEMLTSDHWGVCFRVNSALRTNAPALPVELVKEAYRALGLPFRLAGVPARYTFDRFLDWVDDGDARPFFAYLHCLDLHDYNFLSAGAPDPNGALLREDVEAARALKRRIDATGSHSPEWITYQLSIGYVDRQIARLIAGLRARGVWEDTVLVLCSDHGFEFGDPRRPYVGWEMKDVAQHVLLAFHGPGVPARVEEGLSSLLDLAPTALDLAGLEAPPSFRGESLLRRAAARPWVINENLGKGPCNFDIKPVTIAVRDERYAVICKIPPLPGGKPGTVTEIYDLRSDPFESRNLVGQGPIPEGARPLLRAADRRTMEIKRSLGLAPPPTEQPAPAPAAAESLDFDRLILRLLDSGRRAAVPAIEAALLRLAGSAAADASGFELEDLVEELKRGGDAAAAGWIVEAVQELTATPPLAATT